MVVAIVIAVVLFPVLSGQIKLKTLNGNNAGQTNGTTSSLTGGNLSSTQFQLLQLVPTIFVIAVVGIPVAMLAITFKEHSEG